MTRKRTHNTHDAQSGDGEVVVDYDAETNENTAGTLADALRRLKKNKKELAACKKERQEYLDGWQRCKADGINEKKDAIVREKRARAQGIETVVRDLLPLLDSFDMAFTGESWEKVDRQWREGIEYLHRQFVEILTRHGVEVIGTVGEKFDPTHHEAVEQQDDAQQESGTIIAVRQRGYRLGEHVIRPARVVVAR